MNPSEEIKSRLDLVDFLKEYLQLKPAGSNFRTNCPFHNEKTASFMVSPEKQIWHCFGCGRGGDIFGFLMELEGLNFSEALRQLAPKANVELKRGDFKESSKKNKLLEINALVTEYYHRALLSDKLGEEPAKMRQYLERRGLGEKEIKDWQIGYSPNSFDDLLNFLVSRKYSLEDIFLAGVSLKKDNGGYFNRFRNRIMFPIFDINSQPIAFTARISPEASEDEKNNSGKYINSPQSTLYDKSKVLFALDRAKKEIREKDLAVIVEGQMDAIACHNHGYKNVVASSGTALTAGQLALIKRYTNNIALAFDADAAGAIATDRGIAAALEAEMTIKIILSPGGKDPDESLAESPEEFAKAFESPLPWLTCYLDYVLADMDLSLVENKRRAVKKVLTMFAVVKNRVELDHGLKLLAERISVSETILRETLSNFRQEGQRRLLSQAPVNQVLREKPRAEKLSESILALVLKFPDIAEYIFNSLEAQKLLGESNSLFYKELLMYYNNQGNLDYKSFKDYLAGSQPDLLPFLDYLALLGDKDFSVLESLAIKSEAIKLLADLNREYLRQQLIDLEKQISLAEEKGEDVAELFLKMQELSATFKKYEI